MWVILFGYFYRIWTLLTFGEVIGEDRHVGGPQGRKPDDERHRLRRGREKFRRNLYRDKILSA